MCNRPPHPGEPCLEDQRAPGESDQIRQLQEAASPGSAAGSSATPTASAGAAGPSSSGVDDDDDEPDDAFLDALNGNTSDTLQQALVNLAALQQALGNTAADLD